MKKKLSLFLVALFALVAYAASTTWKVTADGATSIEAGTTLTDNDVLLAKTVYASNVVGGCTIGNEVFDNGFQVRVAAFPSGDDKTGTEQSGSTPVVITAKKDCDLTVYYRRQSTAQTENKGAYADNDGKDLIVYKQSDLSKLSGTLTIDHETDDGKYGWATKKVSLTAGETYTLCAKGTTIQFFGFTYETEDPQPAEASYYVVGTMNEWKASDAYKLATNAATEGEYMTTLKLAKDDELKVIKVEGETTTNWYPDGMDNNLKVEVSGEYDIYFRPDGQGGQDWYHGYIYLALKDEPAVSYTVHLDDGQVNGTVEADKYEVAENEQVLLKVTPNENYEIDQVSVIDVTGAPIETRQIIGGDYNYSFVMPGGDVYVSATFKEAAEPQPEETSFTIKFKDAGEGAGDGTAAKTSIEDLIADGAVYVKATTATKAYNGKEGYGVKLSSGSVNGSITLTLAQSVKPTKITFKASAWVNSNDVADAASISINGKDAQELTKDLTEYTVNYDGETEVSEIAIAATKRAYITELTVTYTDEGGGGDQPVDIKTLAINGEFPGMSWNPEEGIAMQPEATAAGLWTLELKNVTVEGKQYDYKAFADGKTDGYQLPAQGNNNWVFGTDEYPAGTYDLLFTANTSTHELTLAPTYVGPNTIAQLNALANKKAFTFTGNAIVVAKMKGESSQTIDNYIYIKDETGSSLIYDQGGAHSNESDKTKGLLVGDVITAPWNGTVSIYKNLFEVRPAGDEQLTASENVGEVTYPEATPDDVTAENVNKVVEIKGLTIYNVDGKNIKFTIGDDFVNGWNQFGIELPEVTEGKTFDVVGAISRYNDNIQFQPITITEVVAPVEDVYSVAGSSEALFGSEWNEKEGNEMTLTEGKYTWTKEKVAVPAGEVNFKVVKNHSWEEGNWPEKDYVLNIPETAEYTVTITFDEETKAITAEATKTGEAQIDDVVVLAGEEAICGSSWNDKDEANMMAQSPTAANLYTITKKGLSLNKGTYQYKVVLNGTWYPEGTDNNMRVVIENSGIYDIEFTFNKETKEMNAVPTKTGEPSTFTVTFKTDRQWEKVYAYTFDPEMNGEWPGDGEGIQKLDEGVYTYTCVAAVAPGFIIFNNGEQEQTGDLPFVNGTTYTFSEEKATAWAGNPDVAIPAETGIIIPAETLVKADVQAEKIIHIVAKEISTAAPAKGFNSDVAEFQASDILILKNDGSNAELVPQTAIEVVDDGYQFKADFAIVEEVTKNGLIVKPANDKKIGIEYVEVEKAKAPAPVADIVYDFAAEQALIAAGTITKPTNVGGSAANGQAFFAWESSSKTDSKRQDYKGYGKVEGSTLPDECHIWRRSDRFDQDASWNVTGGVTMPNDREFAIDGLTPGSKVVIEYDATNATEGNKEIIWATGDGSGEGLSLRAAATIGGAEAVSGETAIPSGAEILVTKVTPAEKGSGYIVVKVKKNMVISKISVTVNEDAKAYAVNVSDAIENGTVKVSRPTAYAGDEVVVTATPAEGYKLDAITVTGVNTNEAVVVTDGKFTMPADDVTVSATFAEKLDYYLVGNMTDWKPLAEYKLTANTAAEGVEYMITVDLAADAQFKIAKSNGTTIDDANYYPSGMGNNYGENGELQGAGKYTVYFRPNADGGDDWFYHVIFVQKFYNITVVNCDGMTITPEVTEATAGTKVWATVAMTEGYEPEFPGFTNTDTGDVIEMTEGTDVGMDEETGKVWIIMPAQNLTITAKAAKVSLITLDLSQENGSATCISVNKEDPASFYKKEGKEIYLNVTPDAGYTAEITVTAGEDPVEVTAEAGTYKEQAYTHKFIMPGKDVTVKVTFTKSTAINGIVTDDADDNAPIYNLAGQKVDKNYKGVVIKNGKKVYQK